MSADATIRPLLNPLTFFLNSVTSLFFSAIARRRGLQFPFLVSFEAPGKVFLVQYAAQVMP